MPAAAPQIWTIGHSTRSLEEFLGLLHAFSVTQLVDVRHFPGSRKYPHFNQEPLHAGLAAAGIGYEHIVSLGGRRKPDPDSVNTAWRHPNFRGYADYMSSPEFLEGFARLEAMGRQAPTAYMCSEAVWWRCHRSLISDLLKVQGWQVLHILDAGKAKEHPFTAPAQVVDGKLVYGPG
ncbi:MAG: DUF488 domain-containing protein [Chitinophagaceae bacterium]|nr:MAG: DUF488 domain-containing protein [Chitinophagaceae bacterium]